MLSVLPVAATRREHERRIRSGVKCLGNVREARAFVARFRIGFVEENAGQFSQQGCIHAQRIGRRRDEVARKKRFAWCRHYVASSMHRDEIVSTLLHATVDPTKKAAPRTARAFHF